MRVIVDCIVWDIVNCCDLIVVDSVMLLYDVCFCEVVVRYVC